MLATQQLKSKRLKAFEKRKKQIEARNAKFKKMSRMEQRVELAKEVLGLLKKSKELKPKRSTWYIGAKVPQTLDLFGQRDKGADWQSLLPLLPDCKVCNIGIAAFASIKMRDGAKIRDFGRLETSGDGKVHYIDMSYNDCQKLICDLFEEDEIRLMEAFFENDSRRLSAKHAMKVFWTHIRKNKGVLSATMLYENDYPKAKALAKKGKL